MNDPWTWTTVWGLTVGAGDGLGGGGKRGKNWDHSNSITIKKFFKSISQHKFLPSLFYSLKTPRHQ